MMMFAEQLNALEARIPALLTEYEGDTDAFWQAFAGIADTITEAATESDWPYVSQRLDAMLTSHGLHAVFP